MCFKFTQEEIEQMEKMITDFADDSRKPFLCGTEIKVREIEFDGRKYEIGFSIEAVDEDEEE